RAEFAPIGGVPDEEVVELILGVETAGLIDRVLLSHDRGGSIRRCASPLHIGWRRSQEAKSYHERTVGPANLGSCFVDFPFVFRGSLEASPSASLHRSFRLKGSLLDRCAGAHP